MSKALVAFLVVVLVSFGGATTVLAKGGGGGHGGGGHSSGGRGSSGSVSRPSTSVKPSTPAKPAAPRISTKPSAATKTVVAATPVKSTTGKTMSSKGKVVDSTYQPRFAGGYVAPAGSVVYYPQSSMLDWLPFYMIMTMQSHREVVVQTPASSSTPATEKTVKEEGVDTMYILNWIITILFVGGIIALIVYFVNSSTTPKRKSYV